MMHDWSIVRLGEVMNLHIDAVPVDAATDYPIAGVYSFARGLLAREPLSGSQTTYRVFHRLHENDFVISQPKAWEGALARVTKEFDGWFLSPVFPTFRAISKRLEIKYFEWYCRQSRVWDELRFRSRGMGARRESVSADQFLSIEIPLPPLDEQRRLVARIEALATKIEEARGLRRLAVEEAEALPNADLSALVQKLQTEYETKPLDALLIEAGYGTSVKCNSEREANAVPVLRIPNVASEKVMFTDLKFGVLKESELEKTALRENDVLVVRTNGSAELVGRCAVVPHLSERTAFASYMIRLRCDPAIIDPHYLQLILRHQRSAGFLFEFARTTAGQYNVSLGRLRSTEVPLPPLEEQRRIVAYLDGLQARVDALKALQSQTQAELNALLPSVLDKAFKGEL